MNEITGRRLGALMNGRCPECSGDRWQPGPQALGTAQNFECAFCARRYNITIIGRTVMFAQAIDQNGDWAEYRRLHPVGPLLRAIAN